VIHMPRRSVTRFFIPLVDVMMLLFSMFLLMPILEERGAGGGGLDQMSRTELVKENQAMKYKLDQAESQVKGLLTEIAATRPYVDTQKSLSELKKELALLKEGKVGELSKRLFPQVLMYNPKTDGLIYYDPTATPGVTKIQNSTDAASLIAKHRIQAQAKGLDLHYFMLHGEYFKMEGPNDARAEEFKKWFVKVPYKSIKVAKIAS
jgi:hypothetical protein